MEFRTVVPTPPSAVAIKPADRLLFVGSCFAEGIGARFKEEKLRATVNPFGVMYNPASILHTVERWEGAADVAFFTLGTNHVYRLRATGEIVDNCQKRPQRLFEEEELGVEECADCLARAVASLRQRNERVRVIVTVSPIRYAKYGYHASQLSKATLLLAADRLVKADGGCEYFPAYEIVCDELRDYRFYADDMLHPSPQAVGYIYERFAEGHFDESTRRMLSEWKPVKAALAHKPFHPESPEYQAFQAQTLEKLQRLKERYPDNFA